MGPAVVDGRSRALVTVETFVLMLERNRAVALQGPSVAFARERLPARIVTCTRAENM
jgi:hypothetical protein